MAPAIIIWRQEGLFFVIGQAKVIKLGTTNYGHASSLVAEVRALKDGLCMAIQAGYSRICVEGDNLLVIKAFKDLQQVPLQIKNIVQNVLTGFQQGWMVTFNHVF